MNELDGSKQENAFDVSTGGPLMPTNDKCPLCGGKGFTETGRGGIMQIECECAVKQVVDLPMGEEEGGMVAGGVVTTDDDTGRQMTTLDQVDPITGLAVFSGMPDFIGNIDVRRHMTTHDDERRLEGEGEGEGDREVEVSTTTTLGEPKNDSLGGPSGPNKPTRSRASSKPKRSKKSKARA